VTIDPGKSVRDAAARLITDNTALRAQLDTLSRERASIPVDALAVGLAHSVRAANEILAATPGPRFVVSDVEAAIRVNLRTSGDAVEVVLTDPTTPVDPASVSTVSMKFAHVPPATSAGGLRDALERAQAELSAWPPGDPAATGALDAVTRLLTTPEPAERLTAEERADLTAKLVDLTHLLRTALGDR